MWAKGTIILHLSSHELLEFYLSREQEEHCGRPTTGLGVDQEKEDQCFDEPSPNHLNYQYSVQSDPPARMIIDWRMLLRSLRISVRN